MNNVWANVEALRASRGLSTTEMAKLAGFKSRQTYDARKYHANQWTLGQLAAIAKYFNKPLEWLLAKNF